MVKVVANKPTSPGRRFSTRNVDAGLHTGAPYRSLTVGSNAAAGRNNTGRITVRHRGGGHRRRYRFIDFHRTRDEVSAVVERLEYDPNRSANIALLLYQDGRRSYVLATESMRVGLRLQTGSAASVRVGNAMPLANMPLGSIVSSVELKPGKGAQFIRSAGTSAQLLAREGDYATLRLRSGEMRRVPVRCRAVLGAVSNGTHNLHNLGKAGASRWRGRRPTVRGVAMNPVDHPHGGGEGRSSGGRHPVSPWGVPAKGYKTVRQRNPLIVRPRSK